MIIYLCPDPITGARPIRVWQDAHAEGVHQTAVSAFSRDPDPDLHPHQQRGRPLRSGNARGVGK